jgi:YVTN family beta-propeller protein
MMKLSALRGHVCLVAAFLCLLAPIATTALGQTVVATIPTSNPPGAVDVDPIAGRLYIPFQNQILVASENTNQVIHTITVGLDLEAVAVDPLTSRLYAADPFQGLLYVIDTKTFATVATITLPYARTVAVNALTNRIYVSNSFYVFVIDGSTNQTLTLISLDGAHGLAINPMTNRIFIAQDVYPGAVAVINGSTNTIVASIPAGDDATFDVAVDYFRNQVYATNDSSISVIDGSTNTLTITIPDNGQPGGIAVDPVTRTIYVNNEVLNEVEVINAASNQPAGTVQVGTFPFLSVIDLYRGTLYVGDYSSVTGEGTFVGSGVSVLKLPSALSPVIAGLRPPAHIQRITGSRAY